MKGLRQPASEGVEAGVSGSLTRNEQECALLDGKLVAAELRAYDPSETRAELVSIQRLINVLERSFFPPALLSSLAASVCQSLGCNLIKLVMQAFSKEGTNSSSSDAKPRPCRQ